MKKSTEFAQTLRPRLKPATNISWMTAVYKLIIIMAVSVTLSSCTQTLPHGTPTEQQLSQQPGKMVVGVLLPLSGKNSKVGESMLKAVQMAAFDNADERLVLLPRDTTSTPEGAQMAALGVMAEGATAILGPVFSDEVAAVKKVAGGVKVIAFSNDEKLADANTYIMGITPASRLRRLTEFAKYKKYRLAAFVAKDMQNNSFWNEIAGEYPMNIKFYETDAKKLEKAIIDFAASKDVPDAIVLSGSGDYLRYIAGLLLYKGVNPKTTKFMGISSWNEANVIYDPSLAGGLFADVDTAALDAFTGRYEAAFGVKPHKLAPLAYEAVAMTTTILQNSGGENFADGLNSPSGFSGIGGKFRLASNGTAERLLSVYEISPQQGLVNVMPAPQDFAAVSETPKRFFIFP